MRNPTNDEIRELSAAITAGDADSETALRAKLETECGVIFKDTLLEDGHRRVSWAPAA